MKGILKKMLITEKSNLAGFYVFAVAKQANKPLIKQAVKEQYKVTPRRVNIIKVPEKKIRFRGKVGIQPAMKKAVVFLKKGDKIESKVET